MSYPNIILYNSFAIFSSYSIPNCLFWYIKSMIIFSGKNHITSHQDIIMKFNFCHYTTKWTKLHIISDCYPFSFKRSITHYTYKPPIPYFSSPFYVKIIPRSYNTSYSSNSNHFGGSIQPCIMDNFSVVFAPRIVFFISIFFNYY